MLIETKALNNARMRVMNRDRFTPTLLLLTKDKTADYYEDATCTRIPAYDAASEVPLAFTLRTYILCTAFYRPDWCDVADVPVTFSGLGDPTMKTLYGAQERFLQACAVSYNIACKRILPYAAEDLQYLQKYRIAWKIASQTEYVTIHACVRKEAIVDLINNGRIGGILASKFTFDLERYLIDDLVLASSSTAFVPNEPDTNTKPIF